MRRRTPGSPTRTCCSTSGRDPAARPIAACSTRAMHAARQASTLDPSLGEAWAVLGYLLCAAGKIEEGQAAARRATALEPDNWRHHYRLAYGAWGEERLRAVDRTLTLMPGFAPGADAGVHGVRGARHDAIAPSAKRRLAPRRSGSTKAITRRCRRSGFHWLRGMILRREAIATARSSALTKRLRPRHSGHVYGASLPSNAHVAAGFTHCRRRSSPRHRRRSRARSRSAGTSKGQRRHVRDRSRSDDRAAIDRAAR